MKDVEGYFDNISTAATNEKSVLEQQVANNAKLAVTNEELVTWWCIPIWECTTSTFILAVFEDTWVQELQNTETFYTDVAPKSLLTHLQVR